MYVGERGDLCGTVLSSLGLDLMYDSGCLRSAEFACYIYTHTPIYLSPIVRDCSSLVRSNASGRERWHIWPRSIFEREDYSRQAFRYRAYAR